MLDVLDLPEVRQRVSRLTVDEYHQLGEFNASHKRTELIRGIVIEKMSKSPLHSKLGSILQELILKLTPAGWWVRKDEPLTFADSEPEPDVSVVAGGPRDYSASHPKTAVLVIEVAVSSVGLDRELASMYAEAGVKEYWIVLGKEKRVEVYRQPENGVYQEKTVMSRDQAIVCATLPEITFGLAELFD